VWLSWNPPFTIRSKLQVLKIFQGMIDKLLPTEWLSQQILGTQSFRFGLSFRVCKSGNEQNGNSGLHSPEF
jgi:hypothetical protein